MMLRLDQLEIGDDIVVWKALEAGTSKDGDEMKVRVLVHVEKRPKFNKVSQPDHGPAGEDERGSGSGEAVPASPPPVEPESPLGDSIDSDRLQLWRAGVRKMLSEEDFADLEFQLSGRGYDFNGMSEVEWDEVVRPIVRALRA